VFDLSPVSRSEIATRLTLFAIVFAGDDDCGGDVAAPYQVILAMVPVAIEPPIATTIPNLRPATILFGHAANTASNHRGASIPSRRSAHFIVTTSCCF